MGTYQLGHNDESEILTIIARLRENKFNVLFFDANSIKFEIVLTYRITVPVPSTRIQKIEYFIDRCSNGNFYDYYIKHSNDIDNKFVPFGDGYIIWGLLEEKIENYKL